jgi:hypothetical protein
MLFAIQSGMLSPVFLVAVRYIAFQGYITSKGHRKMNDKIKVLYIGGAGRSGSTILGKILGQVNGFFSLGEICYVWVNGFINNAHCGCGEPFSDCEAWQSISDELLKNSNAEVKPDKMDRLRYSGMLQFPLAFIPGGKRLLRSRQKDYLYGLEKLYQAIQASSGCKLIVDASKFPSYGYMLSMIPAIDLYVVHLVRNPYAVTFSWLRKKRLSDGSYMPRYSSSGSIIRWVVRNLAPELIWKRHPQRYIRLRYEDFIASPKKTVESILDFIGESTDKLPFETEHEVRLKSDHMIWGNPNRFQTGTVTLRLDDEWRNSLSWSDRIIIAALGWPLIIRYGYHRDSPRNN